MILNGKGLAEKIISEASKELRELKNRNINPKLSVIVVGDNPASKIYVNNKKKLCEQVDITFEDYHFDANISESEIIALIEKLNSDATVSGIIVQLPLPCHLNSKFICEKIVPCKDVDGFTSINSGKLMQGNSGLVPCTAAGIIEIIKYANVEIEGKHCVIIGRSDTVGKPTAMLLLHNNATVTICHSKTKDISKICREADIIISAVGKENFITKSMVKKGSIVIDVGINRDSLGKICGDVDFENVESLCSIITPVPGGVGPMTVAMLVKNIIKACKIQNYNILKN